MGKRRIIVPNPKIGKNDIGKKDKNFNDIYTNNIETVNISTDNINTEKINGEIIDEERYLENQFTIIYPNNGNDVSRGTMFIKPNPFPGYYVTCKPEIYVNNKWAAIKYYTWYSSKYFGAGVFTEQSEDDTIVVVIGSDAVANSSSYRYTINPLAISNDWGTINSGKIRIKIWKVGKIK